ncbi:helix-turn-helix transcriptional regulator [Porphyromonas gulae]|uniref:DNA-binding protein n=1 Tax=Porphyromonas gulae TaxID=111105 RepID=A0A0A2FMU6_9PORP|nr:helix-turn-helix transcriptional regulator [Porphyromonas gulae]KGN91452.1 DNA-binding protein [Porphyromonas gulae]
MAMNRIKAVLAEKQLTSKWLAQELGKAENTVSRWCSNKVQPSLENLVEIAKVLDIEVRILITPTKEKSI